MVSTLVKNFPRKLTVPKVLINKHRALPSFLRGRYFVADPVKDTPRVAAFVRDRYKEGNNIPDNYLDNPVKFAREIEIARRQNRGLRYIADSVYQNMMDYRFESFSIVKTDENDEFERSMTFFPDFLCHYIGVQLRLNVSLDDLRYVGHISPWGVGRIVSSCNAPPMGRSDFILLLDQVYDKLCEYHENNQTGIDYINFISVTRGDHACHYAAILSAAGDGAITPGEPILEPGINLYNRPDLYYARFLSGIEQIDFLERKGLEGHECDLYSLTQRLMLHYDLHEVGTVPVTSPRTKYLSTVRDENRDTEELEFAVNVYKNDLVNEYVKRQARRIRERYL